MPHALSAEMQERGNGLPTVVVLCNQSRMAKTKENAAAVALGRPGGLEGGRWCKSLNTEVLTHPRLPTQFPSES